MSFDVSTHAGTTRAAGTTPFRFACPVAGELLAAPGGATTPHGTARGGGGLVPAPLAGRHDADPAPLQCGRLADPDADCARRRGVESLHGPARAQFRTRLCVLEVRPDRPGRGRSDAPGPPAR